MHIKKQRLLTPGPTPLLPKALHAMMESDVHHRTEAFRKIYTAVLADLKRGFQHEKRRSFAGRLRDRSNGSFGLKFLLAWGQGDRLLGR